MYYLISLFVICILHWIQSTSVSGLAFGYIAFHLKNTIDILYVFVLKRCIRSDSCNLPCKLF